ncbi:thioredoxin domain-containing protein [soil metagenome]
MAEKNSRPAGRPLWNRIIFFLALFGVLLTVHLHFQAANDFARGCFGFASYNPEATVGCAEVTASQQGSIMGLSNVIFGFFFYVILAALRFARPFVAPHVSERLRQASFGLVGLGLAYSLYLVAVQAFIINEFCVLCMISAGIVAILFILHVIEQRKVAATGSAGVSTAQPQYARRVEARTLGFAVLALVVLVAADVVYATQAFSPEVRQQAAATQSDAAAEGTARPTAVAEITGDVSPSCRFDDEMPVIEDLAFLTEDMPFQGNADAPITVIEFFDPNCPHCRHLHAEIKPVIGVHSDLARFYMQPYPIWDHSIPQIQAMYAAREEGKWFEMIDSQFARQIPGGMTRGAIIAATNDIGMDGPAVVEAVLAGAHRTEVNARHQAVSSRVELQSVPRLAINGRFVAQLVGAMNAACISHLVQQEHERVTGG